MLLRVSLLCTTLIACGGTKRIGDLPPGTNSTTDAGATVSTNCATGLISTPPAPSGVVVRLSAGDRHSCAAYENGAVQCWGDNRLGQVGDGTDGNNRAQPVGVSGLDDAVDVASGLERSCALRADGTVPCWGMIGPYGFNLLDPVSSDVPKCTRQLENATAIAGNSYHYCATLSSGEVACWGQNDHGEVGDLDSDWHRAPVLVSGLLNVSSVAVGGSHSCAVADGTVYCWGSNEDGQLGAGLPMQGATPMPQPVDLPGAVAVVAGRDFSCALDQAGDVHCWGRGREGQIGTPEESAAPVRLAGAPAFSAIAAGAEHVCGVSTAGSVLCWGAARDGQSGPEAQTLAETERVTVPMVVGLDGAEAIAAGGAHTCAVAAGQIHCWGSNDDGQLGDGSLFSRATPMPVVGP